MADYHNYSGIKVETAGDWDKDKYQNYVQPGSLKEAVTPDYKPSKPKKVKGSSIKKDDKLGDDKSSLEQAIANDLASRGLQQTTLEQ